MVDHQEEHEWKANLCADLRITFPVEVADVAQLTLFLLLWERSKQ